MKRIVCLMIYAFLIFSIAGGGSTAFAKAKGHGPKGSPPGWEKGEKKGWEGETPPGWSHGKKKGWEGAGMPPGLAKKSQETSTAISKKKGKGKGKEK